ncbi:MAG TPA: hypothetical protein VFZ47_12905, partial [Chitinophagaceae bacterium]
RKNWKWEGKIVEKHSTGSIGYALIEYLYIEKNEAGNISFKVKCFLTLIFKNSGNSWKLVYDQNTIIPG